MKTTRHGSTLLEAIIAGTMLGALLIVSLQLCHAVAGQRRAANERQCATLELANLMDRVAARPWSELDNDELAKERLSAWAADQLPGAELKIDVSMSTAAPNAKRIAAVLRWRDRSGALGAPLRLVTWKYRSVKP